MTLHLPESRHQHWRDALPGLLANCTDSPVEVDCGSWELNCTDLIDLEQRLLDKGKPMGQLRCRHPQTVVAARALGMAVHQSAPARDPRPGMPQKPSRLMVHQGTLRSGDHLQCDGDVLVYGDINPGAKVSASGDVMVWGRLRGIAHAGKDGSTQARIIAMHLRPVQLRIAEAVARGPEDLPQDGFAEQARLEQGVIVIEAAQTRTGR